MGIEFRSEGAVAVITINRPEVANAIDRPTAAALAAAFRRFDADPALHVAVLTGANQTFEGRPHDVWDDRTFEANLMLDLAGEIAITEQAAIEFQVNNLLNNAGNSVTTNTNPWVRGRSYWVGSAVKF